MANEAVTIALCGNGGDVLRYTCADGNTIEKGALLWLVDPMTVSGASMAAGVGIPVGIAAVEKVASDGSTSIPVYTNGVFDLYAGETIQAGCLVMLSGSGTSSNYIAKGTDKVTNSGAYYLGTALEDASANETIAVRVAI